MRLINVHTMELEEYFDDDIPPYAILSHTWGKEEVSFQQWTKLFHYRKLEQRHCKDIEEVFANLEIATIHEKSGYSKIVSCSEKARRDKLDYVWVDTCCIDKTSSAELSEAINSMFRWYQNAVICYAYLSDVPPLENFAKEDSEFRISRWFTRGWTLQELLAPAELVFLDQEWNKLEKKAEVRGLVSDITGIPAHYIHGTRIQRASIAEKMSWASRRKTTRREDIAYCLLGIFAVNMPLLYGEGEKAFTRLQEEIVKHSQDQTFLAWGLDLPLDRDFSGMLSRSPADFAACRNLASFTNSRFNSPSQITNKGLQIRLYVWSKESLEDFVYGALDCTDGKRVFMVPLIPLQQELVKDGDVFWRPPGGIPISIPTCIRSAWKEKPVTIFIRRDFLDYRMATPRSLPFEIHGLPLLGPDVILKEIYPHNYWLEGSRIFRSSLYRQPGGGLIFLRFSLPSKPADSIVVFQYHADYTQPQQESVRFMRSSVVLWEQLDQLRSGKMGEISSLAELFWENPDWCLRDFWFNFPDTCIQTLRLDIKSVRPWVFNIYKLDQ